MADDNTRLKISLFEVFGWGVDYGQLIMEQERDNEDLFDAFQGHIISQKYAMPSCPAPRRQPHGDWWRDAKQRGWSNFVDLVARVAGGEEYDLEVHFPKGEING